MYGDDLVLPSSSTGPLSKGTRSSSRRPGDARTRSPTGRPPRSVACSRGSARREGRHRLRDFNVLQNNGAMAHQAVHHVHFHIIPKPDARQGPGREVPAAAVSTTHAGRRAFRRQSCARRSRSSFAPEPSARLDPTDGAHLMPTPRPAPRRLEGARARVREAPLAGAHGPVAEEPEDPAGVPPADRGVHGLPPGRRTRACRQCCSARTVPRRQAWPSGLCFSVKPGAASPPPSLKNMYKELKTDLGCCANNGYLVPWAETQLRSTRC